MECLDLQFISRGFFPHLFFLFAPYLEAQVLVLKLPHLEVPNTFSIATVLIPPFLIFYAMWVHYTAVTLPRHSDLKKKNPQN